jgi:hypothetical protein
MQFTAVVVDKALFVLSEKSILLDGSKKALARSGEVMHFLCNLHGLPI